MHLSNVPRSYRTSMRRTTKLLAMRHGTASSLLSSVKSGSLFKLKSGSLLNKGSAISLKSIRDSLSKTIRSDIVNVGKVSSKVSSGLTKEYVGMLED